MVQYKMKFLCSETQAIISTELTVKVIKITVISETQDWLHFYDLAQQAFWQVSYHEDVGTNERI